jgi:hypothetical protein
MLSPDNEPIVRATLPLVQEQIEAITGVFNDAMLVEQPELLDLFSRSAQATAPSVELSPAPSPRSRPRSPGKQDRTASRSTS